MLNFKSVPIERIQKSRIGHEWRISERQLQRLTNCKDKSLQSGFYPVSGHGHLKYGLQIDNGDSNHPDKAIFKFEIQNLSNQSFETTLSFKIESASFLKNFETVFDGENKSVEFVLCSWERLFFPESMFFNSDEEVVIKLDGLMVGSIMYYPIEKLYPSFEKGLQRWENTKGKTAIIAVKDQEIFLEQKIFTRMMSPSLFPNKDYAGFTTEFKFKTIERAVKFQYHPHLVYPATFEELMDTAEFFERYGSYEAVELFAEFVLQQINENTVCRIAKCAVETGHEILELRCTSFLRKCIRGSVPIENFHLLPKKFVTNLLKASVTRREVAADRE